MMEALWFWIVSVVVAIYVVTDGFDLGAGALHLLVARNDAERRLVLNAIGPWWDGNEVWLLAGGGTLFLAFPKVLASAFSGFYLALFLVVWCLILRGIAIEFRSHVADSLWRGFFDGLFCLVSALLPILYGAALGNVVRGVPIGSDGYFSLPLFTSFRPGEQPGILDWYTVTIALFALVAVVLHGALFLSAKLEDQVAERTRRVAIAAWIATLALWMLATVATAKLRPDLFRVLPERRLAWIGFGLAFLGFAAIPIGLARRREGLAFAGSAAFLVGLLASSAACVFPVMLRSTQDHARSLTAYNASAGHHSLAVGLCWWLLGLPLVIGYFVCVARVHRGKVALPVEGEGY